MLFTLVFSCIGLFVGVVTSGDMMIFLKTEFRALSSIYRNTSASSPVSCNAICLMDRQCMSIHYSPKTLRCGLSIIHLSDVMNNSWIDNDFIVYSRGMGIDLVATFVDYVFRYNIQNL